MECVEQMTLPPKCTSMKLGLLDDIEINSEDIEPENTEDQQKLIVNNDDDLSCISAENDPIEICDSPVTKKSTSKDKQKKKKSNS